jgi:anti-sigma-K factor RskA
MQNYSNKNSNNASEWIEAVMNSLDGMEKAKANPFLYTRLAAKLERQNTTWEKAAYWLAKPAFAVATIAVFLAINITVLTLGQRQTESELAQQRASEQLLASEFTNTQSYQLVEINEEK